MHILNEDYLSPYNGKWVNFDDKGYLLLDQIWIKLSDGTKKITSRNQPNYTQDMINATHWWKVKPCSSDSDYSQDDLKPNITLEANFFIDVEFWAILPCININIHSVELEFEWLCFGLYFSKQK